LIYQYINHSQAKIQGLDMRGEAYLNSAWRVTGGWVTSKGYKETATGARSSLDTIQPMRLALGIGYKESQWDMAAHWMYTWSKKPTDVGTVTDMQSRRQVTQYVAPGYSLVNLQAQWRPIKDLSVNAGVNNLFNKKYWRWSDVRGLEASSAVIDSYTAPGRNLSLGMRYDF
jgi:hemoglobin/transferrin/lactoferrin receptor protein